MAWSRATDDAQCDRKAPRCSKCAEADAKCDPRTSSLPLGDGQDDHIPLISGEGYVEDAFARALCLTEADHAIAIYRALSDESTISSSCRQPNASDAKA